MAIPERVIVERRDIYTVGTRQLDGVRELISNIQSYIQKRSIGWFVERPDLLEERQVTEAPQRKRIERLLGFVDRYYDIHIKPRKSIDTDTGFHRDMHSIRIAAPILKSAMFLNARQLLWIIIAGVAEEQKITDSEELCSAVAQEFGCSTNELILSLRPRDGSFSRQPQLIAQFIRGERPDKYSHLAAA